MERIGERSFYNLVRLWAYASANRPDGKLIGMQLEDIEAVVDWQGAANSFVFTLHALRLIDKDEGVYSIHNWGKYNSHEALGKSDR